MSIPVKTRTSYPVSLAEAKRHLRIDDDWNDDDDYINSLIMAATEMAENYIGKDISETENTQIMYDFVDDTVAIYDGNLISFTSLVTDSSVVYTPYEIHRHYNFSLVTFENYISADSVTLTYKTGYEEEKVPVVIKQAILIKIGDLYDGNDSPSFNKLLDSYRLILMS